MCYLLSKYVISIPVHPVASVCEPCANPIWTVHVPLQFTHHLRKWPHPPQDHLGLLNHSREPGSVVNSVASADKWELTSLTWKYWLWDVTLSSFLLPGQSRKEYEIFSAAFCICVPSFSHQWMNREAPDEMKSCAPIKTRAYSSQQIKPT